MKTKLVIAAVAFALAGLAAGGSPAVARGADCTTHTDVVVYNTDTARIAGELAKYAAPCTDYYLTITPRTDHGPRPGPLPAIRAAGPQFHAMPEVRLADWQNDVATKYGGDWYAAGVAFRSMMTGAGFAAGDSWAVNEVGEPSNTAMGVDVVKGNDDAREHLVEFVHGLYDGPGSPDPGLVFAARPLQVTTDVAQYKQDLAAWYSDSGFWTAMGRYVKFWGQEAYADARNWGVAGSTLEQRSAYLSDYFLHGSRLAAAGGEATAAARAFFASAYTPIGNASYRWALSELTSPIGYGYTDIGLDPGMLSFVSSQVAALRSSSHDRLGLAIVPHNSPGSETVAISDRLGQAILNSDTDPGGACGAAMQWCDTSVDGAWFNGAWRTFRDLTPPVISFVVDGTPGSNGWYTSDVTVTWGVADPESADSIVTDGCGPTTIDADTAGVTLTCSATSDGGAATQSVTIMRDATPPTATCAATPATLWPPNGKLVPVDVAVTVADALSGPSGFVLTSVGEPSADVVGFDVGTPDVAGLLRAARPGTASERDYALTYTASDAAGNTTQCVATVVVPHDEGR